MSHSCMILLVLLVGLLAPWSKLLGISEVMSALPEKCTLPSEMGKCRASFPRYYHDMGEKKCKEFIWGGCGGNLNSFGTQEECEAECKEG